MNEDDEAAALAFQDQLESQQWQEEFARDPGYIDWLNQLAARNAANEQEYIDGFERERQRW